MKRPLAFFILGMKSRHAGPQPKKSAKETIRQGNEKDRPGASSWRNAGHPVREQIHHHNMDEPDRLSARQRERSFLRDLMRSDDTEEGRKLAITVGGATSRRSQARHVRSLDRRRRVTPHGNRTVSPITVRP